jgi:Rho termination factor, N-terminal domain
MIQLIQMHKSFQSAIESLSEFHCSMFKENHMPFFPFSTTVPIDDLLTALIRILGSSFILYLTVMFVLRALHHCMTTSLNRRKSPIQDAIVPFKRPLTGLTIRQLKQRARTAHIRRYSRMRKPQLIAALQAL